MRASLFNIVLPLGDSTHIHTAGRHVHMGCFYLVPQQGLRKSLLSYENHMMMIVLHTPLHLKSLTCGETVT